MRGWGANIMVDSKLKMKIILTIQMKCKAAGCVNDESRLGFCLKHVEEWNLDSHVVGKKKLK